MTELHDPMALLPLSPTPRPRTPLGTALRHLADVADMATPELSSLLGEAFGTLHLIIPGGEGKDRDSRLAELRELLGKARGERVKGPDRGEDTWWIMEMWSLGDGQTLTIEWWEPSE